MAAFLRRAALPVLKLARASGGAACLAAAEFHARLGQCVALGKLGDYRRALAAAAAAPQPLTAAATGGVTRADPKMQGHLAAVCCTLATHQRLEGRLAGAEEALALAQVACPLSAARVQARVQRQRSVTRLRTGEAEGALEAAREALRLEPPGAAGRARSLRALLCVLMCPNRHQMEQSGGTAGKITTSSGSRSTEDEARELEMAILEYVVHPRVTAVERLAVCRCAFSPKCRGHGAVAPQCVVALCTSLDPERDAVWSEAAELLADEALTSSSGSTEATFSGAAEALRGLLDGLAPGSQCAQRLAACAWRLARATFLAGRLSEAAAWLKRSANLTGGGTDARVARALALVHWREGRAAAAAQCLDGGAGAWPTRDLRQALLQLLCTTALCELSEAECHVPELLQLPPPSVSAAVALAIEAAKLPGSETVLACLQVALRWMLNHTKVPQDGGPVQSDMSTATCIPAIIVQSRVAFQVLVVAETCAAKPCHLLECLDLTLQVLASLDAAKGAVVDMSSAVHIRSCLIRRALAVVWHSAERELGSSQQRWADGAALMERAQALLAYLDGTAVAELSLRCGLLSARAHLRQASAAMVPEEVAACRLRAAEAAAEALRTSRALPGAGHMGGSGGLLRLQAVLAELDFALRLLGAAHKGAAVGPRQVALEAAESLTPRTPAVALLRMAGRAARRPGQGSAALHCLQASGAAAEDTAGPKGAALRVALPLLLSKCVARREAQAAAPWRPARWPGLTWTKQARAIADAHRGRLGHRRSRTITSAPARGG